MSNLSRLQTLSRTTEEILHAPFEWCLVASGHVTLDNVTQAGGTKGGTYQVKECAMAKYPITNAQYQKFLANSNGFFNSQWWEYSSEATQWRKDHKKPTPTAFNGSDLPRFDSMAFSLWLSAELASKLQSEQSINLHDLSTWIIGLPTEQEWQRAALGDTGWCYPWGDSLAEPFGNYANKVGRPSPVINYPQGKSIFGIMSMVGNVWEWCLTGWNQDNIDVSGYTHRVIDGGAWNVSNPDYVRATDRGSHPPRGQLNDCGFRVVLCLG